MDIIEFGKQYGWLVAVGMYTMKWFFDKGWPQVVKWFNKSQDNEIQENQDRRKADAAELERRARIEERQTVAFETIANTFPVINARIGNLEISVQAIRDATTVLVERKATVTTTTIPQ